MITYQSIPMDDLTFQQEDELMLEHIGKKITIPHYKFPTKMILVRNEFLKIRYVSIFCKQNAKSEAGQRSNYNFSFKLWEALFDYK